MQHLQRSPRRKAPQQGTLGTETRSIVRATTIRWRGGRSRQAGPCVVHQRRHDPSPLRRRVDGCAPRARGEAGSIVAHPGHVREGQHVSRGGRGGELRGPGLRERELRAWRMPRSVAEPSGWGEPLGLALQFCLEHVLRHGALRGARRAIVRETIVADPLKPLGGCQVTGRSHHFPGFGALSRAWADWSSVYRRLSLISASFSPRRVGALSCESPQPILEQVVKASSATGHEVCVLRFRHRG